ncbi:MAG: 3-carboxymuconate cyclase-like protein [Herbinix sp.]|nr:3-carboxymuconate cyclase-like protein [Herbinix sp.]
MELIVSGYGLEPQKTIALYQYEGGTSYNKLWDASIENASFVCAGDEILYTITEADDYAWVYSYQREANEWHRIDQRRIEGGALCHITYSSKHKTLFGACYSTGTVFAIEVLNGKFGEITYQEIQQTVPPADLTRAHCVLLNKNEDMLYTVNIALDCIYRYHINQGHLQLSDCITLPKDVGPRHTLLSPKEDILYLITEYSNEIFLIKLNQDNKIIQRISTLPEHFAQTSYCSTLCFSRNGAFLYGANRGAESIALFAVNEDGTLTKKADYPCGGNHPRHMLISKDGNYLIVCNQTSNQVVIHELDPEEGYINSQAAVINFHAPSGILEL